MTKEDVLALEQLVDKYSVGQVLVMLEEICQGKAEHIEESWQDLSLAKGWDKAAGTLDRVAARMEV